MVRRYTFGVINLNYNIIGNRHRFLTGDELGPLVPLTQVITCMIQGRCFVGRASPGTCPPYSSWFRAMKPKLDMIRARRVAAAPEATSRCPDGRRP